MRAPVRSSRRAVATPVLRVLLRVLLGVLLAGLLAGTASCGLLGGDRAVDPDRTLFGASFQREDGESYGEALRRTDDELDLQVVRVFNQGLPQDWPGAAADHDVVVSFKIDPAEVLRGQHDDRMRQWFADAPRDRRVWWVYWHEPENDTEDGMFTAQEYRRAFAHLSELADEADNPSLHATVVLMSYSLDPESGRRWQDWMPPVASVDVLAWDVYVRNGGRHEHYPTPQQLLGDLRAASQSVGKPYGIAEIGSTLADGDDGGERARWITEVGCELVATDAEFASWFDFVWDDGENDYRLDDGPSRRAWRDLADARADDRCPTPSPSGTSS